MKLDERFELIGKGLLVKLADGRKILAIADLHLGFEDALIETGILLPKFQFKETIRGLKEILKETGKVDEIVILGDFKDLFGSITSQEWGEVLEMIDFLKKHCDNIILLKGNHDVQLEPIAKKKGLVIEENYIADRIYFSHGHRKPAKSEMEKADVFVIGHMHPAVVLAEGRKREIYKTFLAGKYNDKKVIILPAFIPLVEGKAISQDANVLEDRGRFLGLKLKIDDFEVYVVGGSAGEENKIYKFGKVKDLKQEDE